MNMYVSIYIYIYIYPCIYIYQPLETINLPKICTQHQQKLFSCPALWSFSMAASARLKCSLQRRGERKTPWNIHDVQLNFPVVETNSSKNHFNVNRIQVPPQLFTEISRAFFWRASSNPQKNGPSPKISWLWREGTYVFSFSIFNPCSRIISLSQNIFMPQTSTHSTPAHEKSGWKLVHHSSLKKKSHTYNYKNLEQKIRVITDDPDSTWAREKKILFSILLIV